MQAFDHVRRPHILANRHADAHPFEIDRSRHGAGGEHALFVKHSVVGQVDLGPHGGDRAVFQQNHRVDHLTVGPPGCAQQDRRAAIGGLGGEIFHGGDHLFDEQRLEDQILGRITAHEQLRGDDKIGAAFSRLGAGRAQLGEIVVDPPKGGIQLRQGNGQMICHGVDLARLWGQEKMAFLSFV